MPDPAEIRGAARHFTASFADALRCISGEVLLSPGFGMMVDTVYPLTFQKSGGVVRLESRSNVFAPLWFEVFHRYKVVIDEAIPHPHVRVTTWSYTYKILAQRTNPEMFCFHWTRDANATKKFPHVHVTAEMQMTDFDRQPRGRKIDTIHVPTGRVSIESVIRMLIDEFDVQPREVDWEARLARTESEFRNLQTQFP